MTARLQEARQALNRPASAKSEEQRVQIVREAREEEAREEEAFVTTRRRDETKGKITCLRHTPPPLHQTHPCLQERLRLVFMDKLDTASRALGPVPFALLPSKDTGPSIAHSTHREQNRSSPETTPEEWACCGLCNPLCVSVTASLDVDACSGLCYLDKTGALLCGVRWDDTPSLTSCSRGHTNQDALIIFVLECSRNLKMKHLRLRSRGLCRRVPSHHHHHHHRKSQPLFHIHHHAPQATQEERK